MSKIRVWLRPAGEDYKVRVDGKENCRWLRDRLRQKGFQSSDPVGITGTEQFVFHAAFPPQVSHEKFHQCMTSMPEVELQLDPA
jgi:hypothetical protein